MTPGVQAPKARRVNIEIEGTGERVVLSHRILPGVIFSHSPVVLYSWLEAASADQQNAQWAIGTWDGDTNGGATSVGCSPGECVSPSGGLALWTAPCHPTFINEILPFAILPQAIVR